MRTVRWKGKQSLLRIMAVTAVGVEWYRKREF